MRTRQPKSRRASTLAEAFDLCIDRATEKRRPPKVLAELMGIELKTLYRWLADTCMPINRIRQFEEFCGASYVSEYLCLAQGGKVVIDIPAGTKARVADLAVVQADFAQAMVFLTRFYQDQATLDETVAALTTSLAQLAYQRANVLKTAEPELALFEATDAN